jgi:hypothetical protein
LQARTEFLYPTRVDLQQLLNRLGSRLSQISAAERAALVREFVLSIDVEAERDPSGKPVFHYQHRRYADGSYWYAHKTPHVIVHITYVFPEPGLPLPEHETAANTQAKSGAHGQRFIVTKR